jgi:hypothetical protein
MGVGGYLEIYWRGDMDMGNRNMRGRRYEKLERKGRHKDRIRGKQWDM